ncbi:MAG: GNAT family N-acetyltransferase [Chloroherpetonaceae bacterium]|nr:GNAT family N-acetyltransferase [Chloroherpetonaceae bacterium]MDW8437953.1 GNAT family N-acetyltransferase [Chloroherpetonaceae bacterium]
MRWEFSAFAELSPKALHEILKARAEVFVVEQRCAYLDPDDFDELAHHLVLRGERGELVAYSRLLPPKTKHQEASIGRALTTKAARRKGFGRLLMRESLARAARLYPDSPIRIEAQAHLEKFYNEFGFERVSELYEMDGIPHIEMLRKNP